MTSRVQWEVSDKERDFKFCHPQIACRDYSWIKTRFYLTGLICCSYFWSIFWTCLWALGEEKASPFSFLYWKFDRVNRSTLTDGPSRCARLTRRPKKVCQAVQRPIKAPFWLILTSFHSFLWLFTSRMFSGATCELSGFGFLTSVCCFNLFCTWGQCLSFFFFPSFFCKMLVPILLGMHASAYFIFGIFISIFFFFAMIYALLS